ncbi:MAG TPA: TraR/DksA C4-type zinc finger protein [Chitinophagales bacterium]|nr:TraR/DksA C4-type zinc finger protein [Chitinophagales bacterium]
MAKKTAQTKTSTTKKVVLPAKKAVANALVKKAAVPAKKVAVKTPTKKALTPAKKAVAKAPAKKAVVPAKKVVVKTPTKKALTPAKKVVAKALVKKAVVPAKKVAVKTPTKKALTPAKKAAVPTKKVTAKVETSIVTTKKSATKVPVKKASVASKVTATKASTVKTPAKKVVATKPSTKIAPKKTETKASSVNATATVKKVVVKTKLSALEKSRTKAHVSTQPTPTMTTETYVHKEKDLVKPQGRLVRYNDEDLQEFKILIEGKLAKAQEEISFYQEQIKNAAENDTKSTGMEDGAFTSEKESLNQTIARQQKLIAHLDNALSRIQNKTYGICRETGQLIPKDRLRAVPHATLCVEAKKRQK